MTRLSTLILGVLGTSGLTALAAPLNARSPSGNKDVIVQIFEWTWDSIAAECTAFIGPAGYGYVQGMNHMSMSPFSIY